MYVGMMFVYVCMCSMRCVDVCMYCTYVCMQVCYVCMYVGNVMNVCMSVGIAMLGIVMFVCMYSTPVCIM